MQTEMAIPTIATAKPAPHKTVGEDRLSDFSTDRRVLLLSAMAVLIGAIGSVVAYALIWLIAAITNLSFYGRFSAGPAVPQGNHLGLVGGAGAGGRCARDRFDGAIWLGKDSRSRHSRGAWKRFCSGAVEIRPQSGDAQAAFLRHFHRHGRPVRRGRADHHDRRRVRFDLCAAISSERGGAQNFVRRGRGGGDVCRVRHAGGGGVAGGGIFLFEWKPRSFIPVAVASIVASVLRVPLLGAGPIFPVMPHAPVTGTGNGEWRRALAFWPVLAPVC